MTLALDSSPMHSIQKAIYKVPSRSRHVEAYILGGNQPNIPSKQFPMTAITLGSGGFLRSLGHWSSLVGSRFFRGYHALCLWSVPKTVPQTWLGAPRGQRCPARPGFLRGPEAEQKEQAAHVQVVMVVWRRCWLWRGGGSGGGTSNGSGSDRGISSSSSNRN